MPSRMRGGTGFLAADKQTRNRGMAVGSDVSRARLSLRFRDSDGWAEVGVSALVLGKILETMGNINQVSAWAKFI